jgi:hypothetical protein
MSPENEQDRLLREQAAVLSTAVNDMSEQMGNVSNGLVSLQSYGRRTRRMILLTIISLAIDLSLTIGLTFVTFNVISSNQRIDASVGSIHCLANAIAEVLPERSAYTGTSIAVLNLKAKALARDVSLQVSNTSPAARHAAQIRYLADIAAANKIRIPPLPVFDPHC